MKKIPFFLISILFLLASSPGKSQSLPPLQPEQDACNALELCGNSFTTPYTYTGYGLLSQVNGTCVTENNSMWLKIKIATAGSVVFTIAPTNPANDYDFAVVNITNTTCSNFSPSNVIRCNANNNNPGSNVNGVIGLNTTSTLTYVAGGTFGNSFLQQINANAGDVYLIMIDNAGNYVNSSGVAGFTIDFTGSTAVFDQGVPPALGQVAPACSKSEKITINLTKPVKCSSIASNGSDFTLSPGGTISNAVGQNCVPGGYTTQIQLSFASPLSAGNYVLNAATGTDGNTLLDICGNALQLPDTLHFVVDPANNPLMIKLDTPACYKARVVLSHLIKCSTVATNGSDFKVTGPGPVVVTGASPINCNAAGLTDTIDIFFNSSISVPGTYTLSVVTGTDGDKVVDTCGYSINNTINWVVSDHGYLQANATPNVLCQQGFVKLDASVSIAPPPASLNCGTNATPCSNPTISATVGNPSATGTSTNSPFYGFYMDARTQMLFTKAQLNAAGITTGTINKIALNVTNKYSSAPYNNFTIKMKCTNISALTDYVPGATIVYGPKTYSTVASTNTFVLDNNYDWDGVSNLIVEICFHNTSYTSSDDVATTNAVMPGAVIHNHMDNSNGCALASNLLSYPPSQNRPNITFYQCPPVPGGYMLRWYTGNYVNDSTAFSTSAFVPSTTIYHVQIMDTNRCYRRDTAKVIVSVRHPQLTPLDTTICYGEMVTLRAKGGATYQWRPADYLDCDTCAQAVSKPEISTKYSLGIYDQYGCGDTLISKIKVNPLPVVDAGIDTSLLYGTSIELTPYTPGGKYFLWSPVTGLDDPNVVNPIASPKVTTIYNLTVSDTNGCVNYDSLKVVVTTDVPILVPTAFSPNNDGMNDLFRVKNITFQKVIEFRVFNRWGQEVYNATDNRTGWDGRYHNVDQEMGVYNYIIRVAWPEGRVQTFKGDVTLIR